MSSYPSVGLCDGGHLWLRQNPAAMSSLWGQVGKGMGSMAAARHYHPSYHENPTLHIGVN